MNIYNKLNLLFNFKEVLNENQSTVSVNDELNYGNNYKENLRKVNFFCNSNEELTEIVEASNQRLSCCDSDDDDDDGYTRK